MRSPFQIKSGIVLFLISSTLITADIASAKNTREQFTGIFCQTIEEDFKTHSTRVNNFIYKDADSLEDAKTAPTALLLSNEDEKRLFSGRVLSCGTRIKLKGKTTASKRIKVQSSTFLEITTEEAQVASLNFAASGEQKTLAVIVDFQDKIAPCQETEIKNILFDNEKSVNAAYQDASYGSIYFTGDIVRVKVNRRLGLSCNPNSWAIAAESAAKKLGYSVDKYNRRIFFLPQDLPCWWGGLGHIGGAVTRSWVRACSTGITIHELGHNFGMHHASHMNSEGGIIEYGDSSDPMGNSPIVGFNAPHKEQMAWVPAQLLTKSSTQIISGLNLNPNSVSSPQILKFPKPDTGDWYYLSFRNTAGFDAYQNYPYMNRVQIHTHKGGSVQTRHLMSLSQGEKFIDIKNGIEVSFDTFTQDTATVQVQIAGIAVTPSVSLLPAFKVGAPGMLQSYTLELTNKDLDLPATEFKLEFTGPSGWSGSFDSNTMMLNAGASGSTALNVIPPVTAKNGTYEFTLKISDGINVVHNASIKAKLQVATPDITAPSVTVKYPTSNFTINPKFLKQLSIICSATDQGKIVSARIFINGLERGISKYNAPSSFASISNKFLESAFNQGVNEITCEFIDTSGNVGKASSKINKL